MKKEEKNFPIDFNYPILSNDEENQGDIEYEKILEKDIESSCTFNKYINKLELKNDFTDEELISEKTKEEIISYKNEQITKLKAYIASLEQEKEDLINSFKNTTNALLDKIKDFESNPAYKNKVNDSNENSTINSYNEGMPIDFNNIERPKTAVIIEELKDKKNNSNKIESKSNKTQRCPNCQKEIPEEEYIAHSLNCLRHNFRCKKCGELIDEKNQDEHIKKFVNAQAIYKSIKDNNYQDFVMILEHGLKNDIVLDEKNGDGIYHLICRYNRTAFLKELINREIKFDINKQNLNKETPLAAGIGNQGSDCAEIMIKLGSDIKIRNKGDLSPLMLTCKYGNKNLFELLLSKGANLNDKNILGETPLSLAQSYQHDNLAMRILQMIQLKFRK